MAFQLLFRNALVIDGTGAPGFSADVAIDWDRIARIGDLAGHQGDVEIDLKGRALSPGFIDAHTHDDRLLLSAPDMSPKVSQGITTVIAGNCGISLAPMPRAIPNPVTPPLNLLDDQGSWFRFANFQSYLSTVAEQPAATNAAFLIGHSTLRVTTMSDLNRSANAQEIACMRDLVEEAMVSGAIGVSTGLFYEPSVAATTEEVIEVCRPLKVHQGLYCTHMRDEGDHVMASLEESFRIGREVGVPVVISHHKVIGQSNYGRSKQTLDFIERSMKLQPICLDCYPYTAGSTILSLDRAITSARVMVTWSKSLPQFAGQDLSVIEKTLGLSTAETIERLLPAGAIYFRMDEQDVQRILQFEETMIGSDGLPHDAAPHPRLWGSFPRVLGHYSRELGLFSLEKAVHKMTGLTAHNFGLPDRGVIKEGAFADLVSFDPKSVDAAATYENPVMPSVGIGEVVVNGQLVWQNGHSTSARPGQVLRRKV
jgi:N-acyl-D-amino-acid deacylase